MGCIKRFVTLSINMKSVDYVKDVGQIPYVLHKKYGYESAVAGYQVESEYLKQEVKGLRTEVVKRYKRNFFNFLPVLLLFLGDYATYSGVRYLLKNAKRIDVLNIYHIHNPHMPFWILAYKWLNPRGIVYLKLDIPKYLYEEYKEYLYGKHKFPHYHFRSRFACKVAGNTRKCDIVSVESHELEELVANLLKREVLYIPNGLYNRKAVDGNLKENIIMCAANLEMPIKQIDVLMEAFTRIDPAIGNEWTLILAGAYGKRFKQIYDKFCVDYPDVADKVILTGEIINRNELMNLYEKAKIFVLPSKTENFSLAALEALGNGDFAILSDGVTSKDDLMDRDGMGFIIKSGDVKDCTEKLEKAIKFLQDKDASFYEEISSHTLMRFSWEEILKTLNEKINQVGINEYKNC